MDGWLSEQLEDYIDDDYLIFDCPGMSLNPILNLLNENSQIVLMMRIIKPRVEKLDNLLSCPRIFGWR